MDIEKQLLVEHSRRNTDRIIRWIGADAARLKSVMEIFLGDDPLLTQRSAWVVGVMADEHPGLLQPWLSKMMRKTREPGVHDAVTAECRARIAVRRDPSAAAWRGRNGLF